MNLHDYLERVIEAAEVIRPFLHRTPVFTSHYLSAQTGCSIQLKAEVFQKTGSFKPRGAINKIKHLSPPEKARGVITVSAGNHAQAVAYAASMERIRCTVIMPSSAPLNKLEATRQYGATVILHDEMTTIFERTEEVQKETGATFIHPFNDEWVICGHATLGLEIFQDVPDVDVIIAGIGGGALISGIAVALKNLHPQAQIIGIEPEGAPTMTRALEKNQPVRLEKIETIADGLAAPIAGELTLQLVKSYVDQVVLVSDSDMKEAIKILLERTKLLVEPAGSAPIAALLSGKISFRGKNVVAVLSGGNLDLSRLKTIL